MLEDRATGTITKRTTITITVERGAVEKYISAGADQWL